MPTTLSWTYVGKHVVENVGDVQRLKVGGIGIDDILGEVTVISLDKGDLTVETGELDTDGKPVQVERTAGHIRAKVVDQGPIARAAATGRPGQAQGCIFQFLGAAGAVSSPPAQQPKARGRAAKGLGRAKPPAKATEAAAPTPVAKRKAPATVDTGKEDATRDGLAMLGAQYADSDCDSDSDTTPKEKRAKSGTLSFRQKDDADKSEYRAMLYRMRMDKLQVHAPPPSCCRHTCTLTHRLPAVICRAGGRTSIRSG
jgi:hypothetical protein